MRTEKEIRTRLEVIQEQLASAAANPDLAGGGVMIGLANQSNTLKWVLGEREEI